MDKTLGRPWSRLSCISSWRELYVRWGALKLSIPKRAVRGIVPLGAAAGCQRLSHELSWFAERARMNPHPHPHPDLDKRAEAQADPDPDPDPNAERQSPVQVVVLRQTADRTTVDVLLRAKIVHRPHPRRASTTTLEDAPDVLAAAITRLRADMGCTAVALSKSASSPCA
jgi:hypothetical protein